MAADYILRHSRPKYVGDHTSDDLLHDQKLQGEKRVLVITGAVIMLVGIIVGFGLARSNSNDL